MAYAANVRTHEAIVGDLLKGREVSVEYYVWPNGVPRTNTVDLTGFPEAHAKLQAVRVK